MRTEETMTAEKIRRKPFVTIQYSGIARIADSQSKLDRSSFSQITAFSMRSASMIPRTLSVCVNSDRIRGSKTNSDLDSKTVCNVGRFRPIHLLFFLLIAHQLALAFASCTLISPCGNFCLSSKPAFNASIKAPCFDFIFPSTSRT